jgi:dipeptidyl aminopeptidase/acylaminoacyl peptidase
MKTKLIWFSIIVLIFLIGTVSPIAMTQQPKKPFTVADEIGLTLFSTPKGEQAEVRFSSDGQYVATWSERGRLDLNRPEDSLRFYRVRDVEEFLERPDQSQPPSPFWVINLSTDTEGPIITKWRWLTDSTGVAFLESKGAGKQRLMVADVRKRTTDALTPATDVVKEFDIRNRTDYVYSAATIADRKKRQTELQAPVIVGTGHSLEGVVLPDDRPPSSGDNIWAVINGKRFEVRQNGMPLRLCGHWEVLALSPDGRFLVTNPPVPEVPSSWEVLFPPNLASSPYRIHAGHQDLQSFQGFAHQYVRVDLQTGAVQSLTNAPTSNDAGWWDYGSPDWSGDNQAILLPGTFVNPKNNLPTRPCVAVVDLPSDVITCVEILKSHTETGVEDGYYSIKETRFVEGDKHRVLVTFADYKDKSVRSTEYRLTVDGIWRVDGESRGSSEVRPGGLEVAVKERFNEAPLLIASNKHRSKVLWDPNPQLRNMELGEASVYRWKDKEGKEWTGGLFKPMGYRLGQRYPLVIQTHGFVESEFRPSGVFPTAFAARALAAAGIAVLQVGDLGNCPRSAPSEGPCAVGGYETGAKQLVSEGIVDPERVGIIGFSRSCFYVMETLTTSSLHLRAASITDGVMEDYFQYMVEADPKGGVAKEADSMIGSAPFGEGLQQWLKRSPGFNLDKITASLLVVGEGPSDVIFMWEPYAALRYLHKPVDLIMLNTDEHVLTNPTVRMASQGGSVDWFRFWLQDYEDPAPDKAAQYTRWRELRRMQQIK